MTTDRELLELAAKAAGLHGHRYCEAWGAMAAYTMQDGYHGTSWDPLSDDGDAFRLAVRLRLDIAHGNDKVCIGLESERYSHRADVASSDRDAFAAVRRAIVRAAADIGATSRA